METVQKVDCPTFKDLEREVENIRRILFLIVWETNYSHSQTTIYYIWYCLYIDYRLYLHFSTTLFDCTDVLHAPPGLFSENYQLFLSLYSIIIW